MSRKKLSLNKIVLLFLLFLNARKLEYIILYQVFIFMFGFYLGLVYSKFYLLDSDISVLPTVKQSMSAIILIVCPKDRVDDIHSNKYIPGVLKKCSVSHFWVYFSTFHESCQIQYHFYFKYFQKNTF